MATSYILPLINIVLVGPNKSNVLAQKVFGWKYHW